MTLELRDWGDVQGGGQSVNATAGDGRIEIELFCFTCQDRTVHRWADRHVAEVTCSICGKETGGTAKR